MNRVLYVVGLGPGDPELITVKGAKFLSTADVIFVPYSLAPIGASPFPLSKGMLNQGLRPSLWASPWQRMLMKAY